MYTVGEGGLEVPRRGAAARSPGARLGPARGARPPHPPSTAPLPTPASPGGPRPAGAVQRPAPSAPRSGQGQAGPFPATCWTWRATAPTSGPAGRVFGSRFPALPSLVPAGRRQPGSPAHVKETKASTIIMIERQYFLRPLIL